MTYLRFISRYNDSITFFRFIFRYNDPMTYLRFIFGYNDPMTYLRFIFRYNDPITFFRIWNRWQNFLNRWQKNLAGVGGPSRPPDDRRCKNLHSGAKIT
jgi:hypothetical protein